jgi:hypothetical protein
MKLEDSNSRPGCSVWCVSLPGCVAYTAMFCCIIVVLRCAVLCCAGRVAVWIVVLTNSLLSCLIEPSQSPS